MKKYKFTIAGFVEGKDELSAGERIRDMIRNFNYNHRTAEMRILFVNGKRVYIYPDLNTPR